MFMIADARANIPPPQPTIRTGAPHGPNRMTRRTCLTAVAGAVAIAPTVFGGDLTNMKELLEASQNEKKSVMLYMKGQTLGGVVTRIAGDIVELRNREYGRIMVRIDAIDAAAMN